MLENFKNCSGLQLSSDPQSELCPKNGFFEGFPDYSLGAYLMATRKVLGNYLWETTWGLMMKNAIVTPLPYGVCKNLTSTKEYYIFDTILSGLRLSRSAG